jgi:hypothetical protein
VEGLSPLLSMRWRVVEEFPRVFLETPLVRKVLKTPPQPSTEPKPSTLYGAKRNA